MIVTVTLNPSVDYVVRLSELNIGSLNRSGDATYFAGGKGINVSQVLHELHIPSVATGFVGGFSGEFIKDFLTDRGIQTNFVQIDEPTRINIKLKTRDETEINAAGPSISTENLNALLNIVNEYGKGDTLVLAGSIPS